MEQHLGWLSLVPPVLAILLAFATRKILLSLLIGILSGVLIATGGNFSDAFFKFGSILWKKSELQNFSSWQGFNYSWNLFIFLFVLIIGTLIGLFYRTGGANAYGEWALKKIKTKKGAHFSTMLLGYIIFFDDYFNCLTVGAVMRPVSDRFKTSRAKLAYLIDSTTAPICILVPVSTWVVEVMTQMKNSGVGTNYPGNPFSIFLESLFFNTYAWLTLFMVFLVCLFQKDFGPMKTYEDRAQNGDVGAIENQNSTAETKNHFVKDDSKKAKLCDLIVPLVVFILLIVGVMFKNGDLYLLGGKNGFVEASQNFYVAKAMFWGGLMGLGFSIVYFFWRKLLNLKELFQTIKQSFRIMMPVNLILLLAWSLSYVIATDVKTGLFLSEILAGSFPIFLLPALIFALSCIISFATGSSWGTFAIMIPIAMPLAYTLAPVLVAPVLGALLAGAIYGDHTSPISDTTILSSIGSGCNHMEHVSSQAVYGGLVASVCFVGFVAMGLLQKFGLVAMSLTSLVLGMFLIVLLYKFFLRRQEQLLRKSSQNQPSASNY